MSDTARFRCEHERFEKHFWCEIHEHDMWHEDDDDRDCVAWWCDPWSEGRNTVELLELGRGTTLRRWVSKWEAVDE